MRALTLWQPWAQFAVTGAKRVETRGWPTKVRGEIAIHAAKRRPDASIALDPGAAYSEICAQLAGAGMLPLGAVVGTVEIVDCLPIEALYGTEYDTELERARGDWSAGRYGWLLKNPVRFDAPAAANGHQGFWRWDGPICSPGTKNS